MKYTRLSYNYHPPKNKDDKPIWYIDIVDDPEDREEVEFNFTPKAHFWHYPTEMYTRETAVALFRLATVNDLLDTLDNIRKADVE